MNALTGLTVAAIQSRSSEASFTRGQSYYRGGSVSQRQRYGDNKIAAAVQGTRLYRVTVWVTGTNELGAHCTCPYDYGGDCKHIVATLLAWVIEPDSFQPPLDLKASLKTSLENRSKAELIDLLLDICEIYPDVVDTLNIANRLDDQHLFDKIDKLLDNMAPWGHLSEADVEAQLRLIARRADRLAQQGQVELARKILYAITQGCVNLCRNYASSDFFSDSVPYDFAAAYDDLAWEQVPEHGAEIAVEIEALFRDVYDPDALGLNEALGNTWCELIDHNFIEGAVTGEQ